MRRRRRDRDQKTRGKLRLGPGGVVYVVVTALILGAAIYTQANLLFWAFGLMIGGFVISVLIAWQSLRVVKVQRLLPSHGVCGDAMAIRYHITNRGWLPVFSLTIHETWGKRSWSWKRIGPIAEAPQRLRGRPHGWVLHLGPHQVIQAEALCWPLRRGRLAFEKIVLSSSFPFGIVRKVVVIEQVGEVLVYPHLYRMNRRVLYSLSHLDPSGRKQVERAGGNEEFFGIRPYRQGDSLKLIDWKHSARTGDLVAREMTQPSPPRVMILLDLTPSSGSSAVVHPARGWRKKPTPTSGSCHSEIAMSNEEKAICLAASLVCDAHFHGYQIGLVVQGVRSTAFPVHHSLPHRTKMLEALATLDLTDHGTATGKALERPSVIIWPGAGQKGGVRSGSATTASMLGAADLDLYVDQASLPSEVLNRRAQATSRREEIEEEQLRLAERR